jgi:hypothetical protein
MISKSRGGEVMKLFHQSMSRGALAACALSFMLAPAANAVLLTDPNDARSWQGATVGTFAALYYGSDTLANRQLVIDNKLLDDGLFDFKGATAAAMIAGGGGTGRSLDTTGSGSFAYDRAGGTPAEAGSGIDNLWIQTSGTVGVNVWDLGGPSTKAAIFNTIDHEPLPQEAIESTVYLSNDKVTWTAAVTERVWLEGFAEILGIKWDGFTYAVGTGTDDTFRYASIIWGGPGALIADGDNEINGVLGLDSDFRPPVSEVPIPAALPLLLTALGGLGFMGKRRRRARG